MAVRSSLQFSVRKALTRPLHYFERNRPYPLLKAVWKLPPLPVPENPVGASLILTTPDKVAEAVWAAYSFGVSNPHLVLRIAVDGQFSDQDAKRVLDLLPGATITELENLLDDETVNRPGIRRFVDGHIFGRKFGLVLSQQRHSNTIYADSDILCFRALEHEVLSFSHHAPRYMLEESDSCYDSVISSQLAERGARPADRVNAGFLVLPQGSFNVDRVEELLEGITFDPSSWFSEQTIVASLMNVFGGQPLPPDRYLLTNRRQFYFESDADYSRAVLRHFTGPTRHLFYMRGLPLVKQRAQAQARLKEARREASGT